MSDEDEFADYEPYAEGDYIPPKAKVRLPDHVTKLRKRTRRQGASTSAERAAINESLKEI